MQQRKEEILAKKAKLAELKRQREQRQKEFSNTRQSIGAASDSSPAANRTENRKELDSLISSLIGDDKGPSTPRKSASPSPSANSRSRPSSYAGAGKFDGETPSPAAGSPESQPPPAAPQTLSFAPLTTLYEIQGERVDREILTYSKGVQTTEAWTAASDSETESLPPENRTPNRRLSRRQRERDEELRQNIRKEIEEELKALNDNRPSSPVVERAAKQQNFPARTLTTEEVDAVTSSSDFLAFVERSSKVIERALDEEYDVLADYQQDFVKGTDDDEDELGTRGKKGRRLKESVQFYDERWSRRRMISDLSFSPKFSELVLASYTKNPGAPYDPDGLVQVWNLHMRDRPEHIFHATSDILTAKFSPFHPNYILGGSYSGQVLLWDMRSRSTAPVQKTPLTGSGHTHPVYSINVVGTQNAHNIVSTSTDGVVCTWSIDMLTQPQEYLELTTPLPPPSTNGTTSSTKPNPYTRPDELAPTCAAFPASDPTYFLTGTEEGLIALCHRYERAGAKAGVDARITYRSHTAPVTSLAFHRATGPLDLGDLVLSTSLDWSAKLWRVRTPASTTDPSPSPTTSTASPLLTLPRDDFLYAAAWSPAAPGVFALVDGAGALELWDLARDTEIYVARAVPTPRGEDAGGRSLNCCAWEPQAGRRVAVGGLDGVVSVFEVGGEEARSEEWGRVKKLVARLEAGVGS